MAKIAAGDNEDAKTALLKVRPIDLRSRRLLYADLTSARLYRADLREAQLQGASLDRAQLQGASLTQANLDLTILGEANFGTLTKKHVKAIQGRREWQAIPMHLRKQADAWLLSAAGKRARGVTAPRNCLGAPIDLPGASCVKSDSPKAQTFWTERAAVLAKVVCQSHETQYLAEAYMRRYEEPDTALQGRKRFANDLLACPVSAQLPSEMREKLQAWRDGKVGEMADSATTQKSLTSKDTEDIEKKSKEDSLK